MTDPIIMPSLRVSCEMWSFWVKLYERNYGDPLPKYDSSCPAQKKKKIHPPASSFAVGLTCNHFQIPFIIHIF